MLFANFPVKFLFLTNRLGFVVDIMRLKKLPTRMAGKAKEKKGEAFISRHAGGLCFDFHPADCSV